MEINTNALGLAQDVITYSRGQKKKDQPGITSVNNLQSATKEDAYKVSISNESVDMMKAAKEAKIERVTDIQQQQSIQVQAAKELKANKVDSGAGMSNQRIDIFA